MNRQLTAYEPPSIQRHRSGAMNKMGAIPALRHEDRIDGLAAAAIGAGVARWAFQDHSGLWL